MTDSDGQGHNYSEYNKIELDRILKDLFERAKAGEESNRLYQNEYANSVLGKGFDPYVKSAHMVEIYGLKIVRYSPVHIVCMIESLAGLISQVQPEEIRDRYLEAIAQAEWSGDFTKEISPNRKSEIEAILSTIGNYGVKDIDELLKYHFESECDSKNESDKLTKDTEITGNVYELSNLLKDPKQITADYARRIVDTFVDFLGLVRNNYTSLAPITIIKEIGHELW